MDSMDRLISDDAEGSALPATLTEAIYGRIRNDILLGLFKPGDKLKLDALRQRYAASVNTLRETLSRLVSEGLVANEGQRGFTVVPASLADLQDITEMRTLLECRAASRSLQRADLDWESRVVAAYHKLSKIEEVVDGDPKRYSPLLERYNREFHQALISACGSRWLLTFHGFMYDQSLRYRMLAFQVRDFPRDQSRREHRQLLDAALARDAETLVAVLSAHINKGAKLYAQDELIGDAAPRRRVRSPDKVRKRRK
jgi:GntR family carbon starvation induced transcriptional regulator